MLLWVLPVTPIGVIETTVETVLSTSRDPSDKLLRCPPEIAARLDLDIEACDFVQYLPPTTFAAERILILTVWRDCKWFADQLPVIRKFMYDLEEARRMPPPPPRPPKAKKPEKLQPYLLLDA